MTTKTQWATVCLSMALALGSAGCGPQLGAEGNACYSNGTCNKDSTGAWLYCDNSVCVKPSCPQGAVGCGCFQGATCGEGLYCSSTSGTPRCELPNCNIGDLNCGCNADRTCNAGPDGRPLVCDSRVCVPASCTQGEGNCACRPDFSCNSGLVCGTDLKCVAPTCTPGQLGCGCLSTGSCAGNLFCGSNGTCQAQNCSQGDEGCGCRSDFTCAIGTNNSVLICVTGKCVKRTCDIPGQVDCPCKSDGTCVVGGSCRNGLCVGGDSLTPPANPKCFTPCLSGALLDSGFVQCAADGLMEACPNEQACREGSCVPDGGAVPTCATDVECPDFKTCIQGKCYSNCTFNTDCGGARKCYRHVCRAQCSSTSDSCPTGTSCNTTDGENGSCLPLPMAQDGGSQSQVVGSFALSTEVLEFTSTRAALTIPAAITLTNNSPSAQEFTIRKLDAALPGPDGGTHEGADDGGLPLFWLRMGTGPTAQTQSFKVIVPGAGQSPDGGQSETLLFSNAATPAYSRWEGRIEVSNPALGKRIINVSYASKPDGRWSGRMYYFANFGSANLDAWTATSATKDNQTLANNVGNAFIRKWYQFRTGILSRDEFEAMVTSTLSSSWDTQAMKTLCPIPTACFPFTNAAGYGNYSINTASAPVPSGLSELPIALDLAAPNPTGQPTLMAGRIATSESLHYTGDPAITLRFDADPTSCRANNSSCLATLAAMDSAITVGGRYETDSTARCDATPGSDFKLVKTPWLLPDFTRGVEIDSQTGVPYKYECRDSRLPLANPQALPEIVARNANLAQSNPVPDGTTRKRRLEIVDGALIDQERFFIIFRERWEDATFASFGVTSYGFMVLKRAAADLTPAAFAGNVQTDTRTPPAGLLKTACTPAMVTQIMGSNTPITSTNAEALVVGMLYGTKQSGPGSVIAANSPERIHYLCHDTGTFDGDSNVSGVKKPCPAGSGVTYFTTTVADAAFTTQTATYSAAGSCQAFLDAWVANTPTPGTGPYGLRLNPSWKCTDVNKVYCDTDRLNLRSEKQFFQATTQEPVFIPLQPQIDDAFRYKTRFRNRQGTSLGFTPQQCIVNSNVIPYCYAPPQIEQARDRVDCALYLWTNYSSDLSIASQGALKTYLKANFGKYQDTSVFPALEYDGFELLNSELLNMLGDEAYTKAFASRFDLANSSSRAFQGSLFEPNGFDLSGGAGNEMYNLYLAVQYYQQALDRFYKLSPLLLPEIQAGGSATSYVTPDTVEYLKRLIRASTQKMRAWSEAAKRYQSFNRPDLARLVVERAYGAAYLESMLFSRILGKSPGSVEQITAEVRLASLNYRAALLDMRDVYQSLSDDTTFFGFAPDFIPFPALQPSDVNAFQKVFATARQSAQVASGVETQALATSRSFDTDTAQFQQELVRLRNNYENQLADICGTFTGTDNVVHPAISKYAYLDDRARLFGDPCGSMGNGAIHNALGNFEVIGLDMKSVAQQYDGVFGEIDIETNLVNQQCNLTLTAADYRWNQQGETRTLQNAIRISRGIKDNAAAAINSATQLSSLAKCTVGVATDCPTAGIAAGAFSVAFFVNRAISITADVTIGAAEDAIAGIQQASTKWEGQNQCNMLRVQSDAKIKTLLLRLKGLDLEALKTQYRLKLALADVEKLRNQATRLAAEQEETEAQTINVAAAQNNPNFRIYKNDAILSADRTFNQAIQDTYLATKVFEYYTSQSYARLQNLFLIRMVAHGTYDLEGYQQELQNAYTDFQQQFGNPDTRVQVISLRDDIMAISRVDGASRARSQADRIEEFRSRLGNTALLDPNGYLTLPFATTLAELSPLTRNHKVLNVEAEVIGSDLGDTVGRVYLRQRGTGALATLGGDKAYFRLPERTAVINTFFNGVRVFTPEVYKTDRLRDRPYVNNRWEFVLNQRDELANKDINLKSLSDIRLYVYYTDFTQ